jgi:hypothetical protein
MLVSNIMFIACLVFAADPPNQSCQFGVMVGGKGRVLQLVDIVKDIGATCVRINCRLKDNDHNLARFFEAGIDVILTFSNNDPSNIDTKYGAPNEWPNAGFPFKSKTVYQQRVREVLIPLRPFLASGRKAWAQCENEIGDAAINPKSRYWRGTTEQYLAQIQAFREAVESISPSIPVVLTSFPSESLSALIEPDNRHHEYAERHLAKLLMSPNYSVVDLHFYGSVEDIPAKVKAIKARMPTDKPFVWISTENGGPDSRSKATPLSWKQNLPKFEELQAKQVSTRLSACAQNGSSLCLWFSLFDLKKETDVFSHLGLLDQDTIPPRRKPAYEAFRKFIAAQKK